MRGRRSVSKGKHLEHPSGLGPGTSSIFSRAPLGLHLIYSNWGVVDRLRRGNRVLWIFVVPIKFSLCSHQVHNGFPNVFQVGSHFVPYALPNFILLELVAKIGLIVLSCIVLYGGVSKVWSIVQDGQIKEAHAELNFELEMQHEQINKTTY